MFRKLAKTSCVDSEIFYKTLGEVKASKKKKGSKLTLFIEDNFYNDAVKWLETRNEDSKDRTNLTSQDVAIIKRKGWKLEGSKILSKNGKEKCENVNYTKFFAKPIRILRTKEETRWTSTSSETTSPYPKKQNNSLCQSAQCTKNKSRLPAGKTACASPYESKRFLTHLQMDLMQTQLNSLSMHSALCSKFAFLCNANVSSRTSKHVIIMQMS